MKTEITTFEREFKHEELVRLITEALPEEVKNKKLNFSF